MRAGSEASVLEAYRAAYATTRDVIAAYKVAESVFRNLHPEITTPSLVRSRVAILIGRDLLASHREVWRYITLRSDLDEPGPPRDEGGPAPH
jgi:hypothetical protein